MADLIRPLPALAGEYDSRPFQSMKVAERCVNDMSQKESDVACSDCSLASHQLNQASNGEVMPSHPVLELHKAYGLNND